MANPPLPRRERACADPQPLLLALVHKDARRDASFSRAKRKSLDQRARALLLSEGSAGCLWFMGRL